MKRRTPLALTCFMLAAALCVAADPDAVPDTPPTRPVSDGRLAELTALLAAQRQALEARFDSIDDKVVLLEQNIAALRVAAEASQREGEGMSADLGSIQGEVRQLREAMATLPSADQLLEDARLRDMRRRLDEISRAVATTEPAVESEDARITLIMAGLAAVCSLIAVIAVVILRPGKYGAGGAVDRRLREMVDTVEQHIAGQKANEEWMISWAAELKSLGEGLVSTLEKYRQGMEAARTELCAEFEKAESERSGHVVDDAHAAPPALGPAFPELIAQLQSIEEARERLACERAAFETQKGERT